MHEKQVWTIIPRSELPPGRKVIGNRWVYVFKDDEFSSFAENVMTKGIDWLDNFKDNAKR